MIQGVISRLAGNSFLLKGWTVTLVAGLSGFAAAGSDRAFALIAVVVVVVFALLDAYYLALERSYRELFDEQRQLPGDTTWAMTAGPPASKDVLSALLSVSTFPIHAAALATAVVVALSA
jgi:hypothetical protein